VGEVDGDPLIGWSVKLVPTVDVTRVQSRVVGWRYGSWPWPIAPHHEPAICDRQVINTIATSALAWSDYMTPYAPVCTVLDAAVDAILTCVGEWWRHWSNDAVAMSRWKLKFCLKFNLKCHKMDQFNGKLYTCEFKPVNL